MHLARPVLVIALAMGVVAAMPNGTAAAAKGGRRLLGGRPDFSVNELPHGRFRSAVEQLPPAARERATGWLRRFSFPPEDVASLRTDPGGGIYYADAFLPTPGEAAAQSDDPPVAAAAVPVSPFPEALEYHSRPGSQNVLFIDFDGESVSGTAWNTTLGRDPIPARAFSLDADYASFSDTEQAAIKRIWQRVAEDFAPFDIDVTTVLPASFDRWTAHALVTRSTDVNGDPNPSSGGGGVAYVDVFGTYYYDDYRPAWIYYNNLSSREDYTAEAVSHEIGHNLGLSHDGKTDGTEYYQGHGTGDISWAPIMGAAYARNVTQWSQGEYYLANNTENDLAIIAADLGYRADDHGDTPAAAASLTVTGGTDILSTTPETDPANLNSENKGIIETGSDIDVFGFSTSAGEISLSVKPWVSPSAYQGGNLHIKARLLDSVGALVAEDEPADHTYATIQTVVPQGAYYLEISAVGTGNPLSNPPSGYTVNASMGQYFITGTLVDGAGTVLSPIFTADMSTDPAWTLGAGWAYGQPAGVDGDPSTGYDGPEVIGYNLAGAYARKLNSTYAVTPAIDCSGLGVVRLEFKRWLGILAGDSAVVEISDNGAAWTPVWTSGGTSDDAGWVSLQYDISSLAAGRPTVYIRWGLSSNTDNSVSYGWNLDEVVILGDLALWTLGVQVNRPAWGGVTSEDGLYQDGTEVQLTAMPSNHYAFAEWTGDAAGTANPLTVLVDSDKAVEACFAEIMTTNYPTPHWWLALHGFASDFENAVTVVGSNGFFVWESYVAGLDPNDPDDALTLSAERDASGGLVLEWTSVSGRTYTVIGGADLSAPLTPVPDGENLAWPQDSHTVSSPGFYRVTVRLAP